MPPSTSERVPPESAGSQTARADFVKIGSRDNGPEIRRYRSPARRTRCQGRTTLDTSARLQTRFAYQTMRLEYIQKQKLDALMSPMSTVPPRKLTSPREPNANGRPPIGWSFIGQQGFPAITVSAGFTTQVWDRVRDGDGTRLADPVAAALPVGVDFLARPFDAGLLVRIASAYEGATKHRRPPPEFGRLSGEP